MPEKSPLTIRVGLANPNGRMPSEMERRELPVMLSANSLFDHEKGRFRDIPSNLMDLDVALDSAGFVAMKRYGRYPWSIAQYVNLVLMGGFTWWSQMDCCCEQEIAGDRETVRGRIEATAKMLGLCRDELSRALQCAPEFAPFTTQPMPILQGWKSSDYELSAQLTDDVLSGDWPDMVGIGSVCRRHLKGEDGLWRVLDAVDRVLPPHVRLHLFGVKGTALTGLVDHPRVVSVDSMAFEFAARIDCRKAGVSKTIERRMGCLDSWLTKQAPKATAQISLGLAFA